MIGKFADLLLLPPGCLFLLLGLGIALRKRRPGFAAFLRVFALAALYACSTPILSASLLRSLQGDPALEPSRGPAGAQAIVVLSGDTAPCAPEYGGATLGALTLERLRYGAALARRTGLPILVSGGRADESLPPAAEMMRDALRDEFSVPPRWVEPLSRTTRENALRSAEMLVPEKVTRLLLVTHAWHMPRARGAFEEAGFEVVPAPTGFRDRPKLTPWAFLPSGRAMREAHFALHEWVGRLWYLVR